MQLPQNNVRDIFGPGMKLGYIKLVRMNREYLTLNESTIPNYCITDRYPGAPVESVTMERPLGF